MISNSEIQSVKLLTGDPYIIYYDRRLIAQVVNAFIASL